MRDNHHYVVDEQSQLPPHLLPPPYLVNIDGHAHPLQYQEAILRQVRPAKVKLEHRKEEMEDYDEYMSKRLARIKQESFGFQRVRQQVGVSVGVAPTQPTISGGSNGLSGENRTNNEVPGTNMAAENDRSGDRVGVASADSLPSTSEGTGFGLGSGGVPTGDQEGGKVAGKCGETVEGGAGLAIVAVVGEERREKRSNMAAEERTMVERSSVAVGEEMSNMAAGEERRIMNELAVQNIQGRRVSEEGENKGRRVPGGWNSVDVEGRRVAEEGNNSAAVGEEERNNVTERRLEEERNNVIGIQGEERRSERARRDREMLNVVDVEESSQDGQNVQNMLSSLVYSLGLNEVETKRIISLWHNRTVIPPLDPSHLSLELAKREQLFQEEHKNFELCSMRALARNKQVL